MAPGLSAAEPEGAEQCELPLLPLSSSAVSGSATPWPVARQASVLHHPRSAAQPCPALRPHGLRRAGLPSSTISQSLLKCPLSR